MSSEIDAIHWLREFINQHIVGMSSLGHRWLQHACQHLEDRVDAELRRQG